MSKRAEQAVRYWPTEKTRSVLAGTTEADLQATVVDAARACGWLVYHTYDSRRSAAGFPDLVLARHGELLFVELKSAKGKTSRDQDEWLDALRCVAGVGVYVWRPEDLDTAIERLKPSPRHAPLPVADPVRFPGDRSPAPRENGVNDTCPIDVQGDPRPAHTQTVGP